MSHISNIVYPIEGSFFYSVFHYGCLAVTLILTVKGSISLIQATILTSKYILKLIPSWGKSVWIYAVASLSIASIYFFISTYKPLYTNPVFHQNFFVTTAVLILLIGGPLMFANSMWKSVELVHHKQMAAAGWQNA